MGSKEKILHLIRYILDREYEKEFAIDMFTGGFSVASYILQNSSKTVIANDINKYVIALYKAILNDNPEFNTAKYDWVSREEFNDVRDNPNLYPDWYVGYVLNVWSFGCNQKDYLYAKDLEENKKALHQAIVFDDFTLIDSNDIFKGFELEYHLRKIDYKKHHTKRLSFMLKFKNFVKQKRNDLLRVQHLERLEQMENIQQAEHLSAITRNKMNKDRLLLYALDWKDLYNAIPTELLEKAFIYCDPPYENTKQYQFGKEFDYKEFWDWFRNCPYPVYVSSYQAPKDIEPINFELKYQLLDNGKLGDNKLKQKRQENIYWNGKGNPIPTGMDLLFNE